MYKIKIFFARAVVFSLYYLVRLFSFLPKKKQKKDSNVIILTGTFYSKNWINAHIVPIVRSTSVKHVYIVSNNLNYDLVGLTVIKPSKLLSDCFGATIARLLSFSFHSFKYQVDYIGGFHILFNGSVSILLANMFRCRSIYFCVGGVTETLEAGKTENNLFKFLNGKDHFLTSYICKIVAQASRIITMGKGAKSFFTANNIEENKIDVISGAIDKNIFYPSSQPVDKRYDLVLTARLSKVKQVNLFIDVVEKLQKNDFLCNALIIGDGPLLEDLKCYAKKLGVSKRVHFIGHQNDILKWLHQSKLYILTSRSEGLALSMLEGLKSGLPAIVPNVGDLSDVLIDGYNGALIEKHSVTDFVKRITYLLSNPEQMEKYSYNAIESTKQFDLECVIKEWDKLFLEES